MIPVGGQYLANETLKEGETKQDWDKIRTLRMLGIGAFFTAPILHIWFNLMLWRFPKTDVASSMKKVLAGQLIASPVVNSSFFAVNSFLQGFRSWLHKSTNSCHDIVIYLMFIDIKDICNGGCRGEWRASYREDQAWSLADLEKRCHVLANPWLRHVPIHPNSSSGHPMPSFLYSSLVCRDGLQNGCESLELKLKKFYHP